MSITIGFELKSEHDKMDLVWKYDSVHRIGFKCAANVQSIFPNDDSANLRECFSDRIRIQKELEGRENIYKTDGVADADGRMTPFAAFAELELWEWSRNEVSEIWTDGTTVNNQKSAINNEESTSINNYQQQSTINSH